MNRDDIIRMAREAGGVEELQWKGLHLERFATLVIQHKALDQLTAAGQYEEGFEAGAIAEREACAKVCEDYAEQIALAVNQSPVLHCAAAIRARGDT